MAKIKCTFVGHVTGVYVGTLDIIASIPDPFILTL